MPWGARKNIGLFLGLIFLIVGIIAILNKIGVLSFGVPLSITVLTWILAIGGLYLIIESATEVGIRKTIAMIVAIAILIITLIPILNQLGITAFSLPFLSIFIYHLLLTVLGFFLVINAFGP